MSGIRGVVEKAMSWQVSFPILPASVAAIVLYSTLRFFVERKKFQVNEVGIVLITGASTGIGRHAAEHIAKKHKVLMLI